MRKVYFKTGYGTTRPIIVGVALIILFGLIGMRHERSLATASQWTRVNIEVLPGAQSKFIDASTRSIVPVAILSSLDFDASTVNPASVSLAGAPITKNKNGQLRGFLADVNGDGRTDLVVYVSVYSLNLDPGTSEAVLTAITFDGDSVSGAQQVSFSPPVFHESQLSAAVSSDGTISNSSLIKIKDSFTPPTTAGPYPSSIDVSGQATVTKVTVSISNYSHTYPDDVDILLVGPTGATCLLMSDCGGSAPGIPSDHPISLTFDDSAVSSVPDNDPIVTGTYRPTQGTNTLGDCGNPVGDNCVPANFPSPAPAGQYGTALSVFNGSNPNGTWQLYVIDDSAGDDGRILDGWSLTINTASATKGTDTPGLYDPTTSRFFLKNTNSAGPGDSVFGYGPAGAGWTPLVGDWNGDGIDTVGLYDPATGTFFLKNTNSAGPADLVFGYGPGGAGWIPLVGDWNGDGTDTVGLYNPTTSTFFLKNTNSAGAADLVFSYGPAGAGWTPLVGDWDGDHVDTVGLFNPSTSTFFLKNTNAAGPADFVFGYGPAGSGWKPLTGDWNGDGVDTIGLYDPATGNFFLKNTNAAGPGDLLFGYGPGGSGWLPLVGDWDGL